MGVFDPKTSLLVKMASIAVHAEELLSDKKHEVDEQTLKALLADPEVIAWLKELDKFGLIPKKR